MVNLEGRPQRLRRAVIPAGLDELECLSRLGERFGLEIDAWAAPTAEELAAPAARGRVRLVEPPTPQAPTGEARRPRPRPGAVSARSSAAPASSASRSSSSSALRPRSSSPSTTRPTRGIAPGEPVRVSSNGTSRDLRARLNRKLRVGVARVAEEHAAGFEDRVQVEKIGA